jgi:RNA polymerase sigma factor (sigma-70 family)
MADDKEVNWDFVLQNLGEIARSVTSRFPAWIQNEIDEIVTDTAAKLWRSGIREPTEKLSYIMIRQAAIDRWRARRRLRSLSEAEVVDDRKRETAEVDLQAERRKELDLALAELPAEDRQLLLRCYHDRVAIGRLAIEAGVSYSAMAVRLHRIKNRLRDQIVGPDP